MTSLQVVYDAFLAKILEDEWGLWTEEEVKEDQYQILLGALPWFKFPRVDLTIEDNHFIGDLGNEEIQILASRMKCEWVNRCIMTWENLKTLYEEKDFSHANLLDKLNATLLNETEKADKLERIYYRSIKRQPFDYKKLAGDQ